MMMKKKFFLLSIFILFCLGCFGQKVFAKESGIQLKLAPSKVDYAVGQIPERSEDVYYRSLSDAIFVAQSGDEIIFMENISGSEIETINVQKNPLTINLNGYSYLNEGQKLEIIQVETNAELRIIDQIGNGMIKGTLCQCCVKVQQGGILTIISGQIINERSACYSVINSGTINVYGGTIIGKKAAIYNGSRDKIQDAETIIYDGILTSKTKNSILFSGGKADIYGGFFKSASGQAIFGFESEVQDQLSIKGGKFSANISTFLKDDDYVCEKNSDGLTAKTYPYVVVPKKVVNISAFSGLIGEDGSIDFKKNIGNVLGSGSYYIGDDYSLMAPKVEGLVFSGWYKKTEGEWEEVPSETCPTLNMKAEENCLWAAGYREGNESRISIEIYGNDFSLNGMGDSIDGQYSEICLATCPLGTNVTISSNDAEQFLYWVDENGKILSDRSSFSVDICHNMYIQELTIAENSNQTALLFLSNYYKQVFSYGLENGLEPILFPKINPVGLGKTFNGWQLKNESKSLTEKEIQSLICNEHPSSIEMKTVEVSRNENCNITLQNSDTGEVSHAGALTIGNEATVKIDSEDCQERKHFGYWTDEAGQILSFSNELSLRVVKNQMLRGRFFSEDDVISPIPVLSIQDCSIEENDTENVLRISVMRSLPEDFELLDQGLLYAFNQYVELTLDSPGTKTLSSSDKEKNGCLTGNLHYEKSITGQSLYCRGYMVIEKGREKYIFYSKVTHVPFGE